MRATVIGIVLLFSTNLVFSLTKDPDLLWVQLKIKLINR